jgi:hypothetical protein
MTAEVRNNLAGDAFNGGAHWAMLEQDGDIIVEETETEGERFRNPTVPRNQDWDYNTGDAPVKRDYATIADRGVFVSTVKMPVFNTNGTVRKRREKIVWKECNSEQTLPNVDFLEKNGIDHTSHPAEWVNLFIPWMKDRNNDAMMDLMTIANRTNMRIMASTGSQARKHIKAFTTDEVMKHFGVYMLNGLNPSPRITQKFKSQHEDPVQGNDMCSEAFGLNAEERHVDFKRFLSLVDPVVPVPTRKVDPNYKINPLIKQLVHVSMKAMSAGKMISVNEQTISFKGKHVDKLRITYKKEGDGFQCDALCADGYTFTVYFRNVAAPPALVESGACPLHARVINMFEQLPNIHYNCGMDNLYVSSKLALLAISCKAKVCIHGVARQSGRGIPKCIEQVPQTTKDMIIKNRGTLKVAKLVGEPKLKDFVAISYYDVKPFYFMTNCWSHIKWIKKNRKVWSATKNKLVNIPYFRLNVFDVYNYNMNNVDISDQLRNVYRWDHWMRKRKWWWSLMFWALQLLTTNAFITYSKYLKMLNMVPLSHYDFLEQVATIWITQGTKFFRRKNRTVIMNNDDGVSSITSGVSKRSLSSIDSSSIGTRMQTAAKRSKKNISFCDAALDPFKGVLRCRLAHTNVKHMPTRVVRIAKGGSNKYCQLHYWGTKKKHYADLLRCDVCAVNVLIVIQHFMKNPQLLQKRKQYLDSHAGTTKSYVLKMPFMKNNKCEKIKPTHQYNHITTI